MSDERLFKEDAMTKEGLKDGGIALLRAGIGAIFVAHGIQKLAVFGISGLSGFMAQLGIPFPTLSAVVVALTVHLKAGFFLPNGAEYVLALFTASVALALTGSGSFSVDRWLEKRAAKESAESSARSYPQPVQVR